MTSTFLYLASDIQTDGRESRLDCNLITQCQLDYDMRPLRRYKSSPSFIARLQNVSTESGLFPYCISDPNKQIVCLIRL